MERLEEKLGCVVDILCQIVDGIADARSTPLGIEITLPTADGIRQFVDGEAE